MSAAPALDHADTLHARIVAAHADYRCAERDLALLLAEMADSRLYLHLGFATVHAYADVVLDMPARQVRALVQIGRQLPTLPALDAAMSEGRLGWTKARELMRVVTPENEAAWVARAEELTSRDLERHVNAGDFGGPPPSEAAKAPDRTRLVFEVDAQDADVIRAAIAMLRAAADVTAAEISDGALFAEMSRRILHDAKPEQAPTGERYRTVLEHCPRCRTTSGIHAEVNATHVGLSDCDGEIQEGRPGESRGHLAKSIPPALRRAVIHRDRWRCTVTGCRCDLWLDIHHIEERRVGGAHTEENLTTLCSIHHRVVHEGLLAVRRGADGVLEFERADGFVLRDLRGLTQRGRLMSS